MDGDAAAHLRNRSVTASVSAFSDNIFGVSALSTLNLFDSMESEPAADPDRGHRDVVVVVDGHQSVPSQTSEMSVSATMSMSNPSPTAAMSAASSNVMPQSMPHMTSTLSFIKMKNQENANEYAKPLTLLDWESFIAIDARTCLYKIKRKRETKKWLPLKCTLNH